MVGSEIAAFMDDPPIKAKMEELEKDYDNFLNDSGIKILAPPICEIPAQVRELLSAPHHAAEFSTRCTRCSSVLTGGSRTRCSFRCRSKR